MQKLNKVPDLSKIFLFRMIHIENISHVWKFGITKIDSANSNDNYRSIGDASLINNRSNFVIPNGNSLGNYIPFYFWHRMPMLYVMQKGFNGVTPSLPQDVVYCITNISNIIEHEIDYVFTDGHAVDSFTSFYLPKDILKVEEELDFKAIKDNFWKDENDLDKKRRKEAEFLIARDIPTSAIYIFAVFNQVAKDKLIQLGIPDDKITIRSEFYF